MMSGQCCRSCYTRTYKTYDRHGAEVYEIRASMCGTQRGCNFCAPTLCNEAFEVDVYRNGEYVNSSTWVWPGCNCGGLLDMSNIVVHFPQNANDEERAALVAGLMLVEYTLMELKRQQERNQRNNQGGAPQNAEMQR